MHIHIHSLIFYARHARLLGGYMRFLGMTLFMLLFSLFQLVGIKPASAMVSAKENHSLTIGAFCRDSTVSRCGRSDPATDPAGPDAINKNDYTSVYHRLKPGIVMVPRMNRTPKPKSVYRCFTRAPGIGHCREV
jgi:hypothetical protein